MENRKIVILVPKACYTRSSGYLCAHLSWQKSCRLFKSSDVKPVKKDGTIVEILPCPDCVKSEVKPGAADVPKPKEVPLKPKQERLKHRDRRNKMRSTISNVIF